MFYLLCIVLICMYILIHLIFHFKHDVLITEKPLWGVFNKVLSYLILSYLKIIVPFRSFKVCNPIITNTVYVSTWINHATLDPVVISNEEINVTVTSYTGNGRNVDGLHRYSCTYLRFPKGHTLQIESLGRHNSFLKV